MAQPKKTAKRPGPRPRGPFADKRRTLTTRITERTRVGLEKAAAASDRSLSQEIEFRLEQTLQMDGAEAREIEAAFGDGATYRLMVFLANAKAFVEDRAGSSMMTDQVTQARVRDCWHRLINELLETSPDPFGDKGLLSVEGAGSFFGKQDADLILQHWRALLAQQAEKKEG